MKKLSEVLMWIVIGLIVGYVAISTDHMVSGHTQHENNQLHGCTKYKQPGGFPPPPPTPTEEFRP